MNAVPAFQGGDPRARILDRRVRLEAAAHSLPADYVTGLLAEIDAALQKIDHGSFGLCETCHDTIDADRLACNPLSRFCLDHLSKDEMRAHERDLELATEIQGRLLPPRNITTGSWETHYRYEPAGLVGGDYCEIVTAEESLFFAVGDVAGKGVAASLLMTHLSAIFRSLLSLDLPLSEVISRANHLFCESTPASHYATLVAGRTTDDGVDLCNAGHCSPLLVRAAETERIEATGLPLGLFCDGRHALRHIRLEPGESLVLYSDGITEAQDPEGNPFEEERLIASLHSHAGRDAAAVVDSVVRDVAKFRGSHPPHDDLTLLIIRRRG